MSLPLVHVFPSRLFRPALCARPVMVGSFCPLRSPRLFFCTFLCDPFFPFFFCSRRFFFSFKRPKVALGSFFFFHPAQCAFPFGVRFPPHEALRCVPTPNGTTSPPVLFYHFFPFFFGLFLLFFTVFFLHRLAPSLSTMVGALVWKSFAPVPTARPGSAPSFSPPPHR